jgi:hypothetical protein
MSRFRVNKLRQRERDILFEMVSQIVDDDLQSKSGSRRELWVNAIVGGLTAKTRLEMVADNGYLNDPETVILRLRVDPITGIRFPEFQSRDDFREFFTANELGHADLFAGLDSVRIRDRLMEVLWDWVKLRRELEEQAGR